MGKRFLEKLQDLHCDDTRTSSKRFRVLRNVGEAAPYFPQNEPLVCFGSGDGFEVEMWKMLGYNAIGCELSTRKREIALRHGSGTVPSIDAIEGFINIYCAHTIEHLPDSRMWLDLFAKKCLTTVCLVFPIEPNGTRNPSHLSPVKSLTDIDMPGLSVVVRKQRWNDELEGMLICKRT